MPTLRERALAAGITATLVPPGILSLLTRERMAPETALLCAGAAVLVLRARRQGRAPPWAALAALAWLLLPRRPRRAAREGRRAVLVTGGASGIGLATARLFHSRGWSVGIYDLNRSALQPALESLPAPAGGATADRWSGVLDVTDAGSCAAAVADFTARSGGRLDCLFNCAGLLEVCDFDVAPVERQLRQVSVNVCGVVRMTYAAHAALKATRGARVVTMASLASVLPTPHMAVYTATKGAVAQLTDSLEVEFAKDDITCTDVAVGVVRTPMVEGAAAKARGTISDARDADAAARARTQLALMSDEHTQVTPELVAKTAWRAAHGAKGKTHYQTDAVAAVFWRLHGLDRLLDLGLLRWMMAALIAVQ